MCPRAATSSQRFAIRRACETVPESTTAYDALFDDAPGAEKISKARPNAATGTLSCAAPLGANERPSFFFFFLNSSWALGRLITPGWSRGSVQRHYADKTNADTYAWLYENRSDALRLTETVWGPLWLRRLRVAAQPFRRLRRLAAESRSAAVIPNLLIDIQAVRR